MDITRIKLSALWTVVMFNIAFADIVGFMHPGTLEQIIDGSVGFPVTPALLLVFSIFLEIPVVMIFLCLILSDQPSRWLNTFAVILTILPGFTLAASSASTPSNSIDGQALNEWVQSGSSTFLPVLQQKIQDRINWQRPKAIIGGVMLAIFVGITVRIWNYLIKTARAREVKWHLKEKTSFVVGIVTVALSLLMLVMVIANMQAAIAPVAISLLGV